MRVASLSTPELLIHVERTLAVLRDAPDLREAMAAWGVDAAMRAEGARRAAALAEAREAARRQLARQKRHTQDATARRALLRRTFVAHRAVCRSLISRESSAARRLGLHRPMPDGRSACTQAARAFYRALQSTRASLPAALAARGLAPAVVQAVLDDLDALDAVLQARADAMAAATDAAAKRKAAREALQAWAVEFHACARLALATQPRLQGMVEQPPSAQNEEE